MRQTFCEQDSWFARTSDRQGIRNPAEPLHVRERMEEMAVNLRDRFPVHGPAGDREGETERLDRARRPVAGTGIWFCGRSKRANA